ncbi:hypothetical protein [Paraburkholderia unamae]|uniref:Uncharacterized protein n=1 Tax=Paraburkholderia unamae TaxID=219649 RepID=A0ACC6RJ56_9BURK
MTVLKQQIPTVMTTVGGATGDALKAIKQNIELITGVNPGAPVLTQLPSTATLAQVITTLNTVIQRLNQQGQ